MRAAGFRGALCLVAVMLAPACQCMRHDKRVPFLARGQDPAVAVDRDSNQDGAVYDHDAQSPPDAALFAEGVSLPAETRRWEDQGAVIELPDGVLRAVLALDLNADSQRDALMVLQRAQGTLELAWAIRQGAQPDQMPDPHQAQAFSPPRTLQTLTPPAGCTLDHASLQAVPRQFATLSLEWRCPTSAASVASAASAAPAASVGSGASGERAVEELVWLYLPALSTESATAAVITSWLNDPGASVTSLSATATTVTTATMARAASRDVAGAMTKVVRPSLDVLANTPRFRLEFEIESPRLAKPVAVSLSWLKSPAPQSPWVLSTAELTGLVRGHAMKVSASGLSKRKGAHAAVVRAAWEGLGVYLAMCREGGMVTWRLASALGPARAASASSSSSGVAATVAADLGGVPCHLAQPASELATAIVQREAARGDVHATMQAWVVLAHLGGYDRGTIDAALRTLPSMWPGAMVRRARPDETLPPTDTANTGLVRAMTESRTEVLPTPVGLVMVEPPSAARPHMKLQWLRPGNWHELPLQHKRAPEAGSAMLAEKKVTFAIGTERYVVEELPQNDPAAEPPPQTSPSSLPQAPP